MSKNEERLQKVLVSDDIAMQMLTPEERELLARYNRELDMLREKRGIPVGCVEPEDIINEAFQSVPVQSEL